MADDSIDREKTCPLLLRCFWSARPGHSAASYRDASRLPESEIQIYTWKNATLREITDLLKEVILQSISAVPAHRQHQHRLLRHVTLTYSLVYPDRSRNGAIVMKTIGRVQSFRSGADDTLTLAALKFQTGDYLDVSVDVNNSTTTAISTISTIGAAPVVTGGVRRGGGRGAGTGGNNNGSNGGANSNVGSSNSNGKREGESGSGIDYGHSQEGDGPWRKRNRRS